MKKIAAIFLLLSVTIAEAQISYWWSQELRKPDAKQSQEFFFVPGQGMFFTYQTNRVILNASGGGGVAQTNISAINLIGLSPGTNVTFSTNAGVLSINSAAAGQTNIPATSLIGFAPGANILFSTNAGVLSISASGGSGSILVTNTFNPLTVAGCVLWLDAGSGLFKSFNGTGAVTVQWDPVQYWTDLSGVTGAVTNATSTSNYFMPFGGPNRGPTVLFGGLTSPAGDGFLSKPFAALAQPYFVFVVCKGPMGIANTILDSQALAARILCQFGTTVQLYCGVALTSAGVGQPEWAEWTFWGNGGGSSIRENGALTLPGNAGAHAPTGFTIGTDYQGNRSYARSTYLSELLVYQAALSGANISDIEHYLLNKWGLTP